MTTLDIRSDGQREALANRLVADLSASMEALGIWLGLRLGLYARWPGAVRPPRTSLPPPPGSTRGMPASGSSSRPLPGC
jgi:hypothetical protein